MAPTTKQRTSEDYDVPEEIASEALLLLQEISQPNDEVDEEADNDYALPVNTVKLPDIVREMNTERGIDTVVDYNAEIPEEMKLKTTKNIKPTTDDTQQDDTSDSDNTIIYEASEHDT